MSDAPFPFTVDPSSLTPIWKQLADQVRWLVITGALRPGMAIPSVRDVSRTLDIHPGTVVQAYRGLAEEKILVVKKGLGTYISDTLPPGTGAGRRELEGAALLFVGKASSMGFTLEIAEIALREAWARVAPRARR